MFGLPFVSLVFSDDAPPFSRRPYFQFLPSDVVFPFRRNPTASRGGRVSETFHKSGDRYIKIRFYPFPWYAVPLFFGVSENGVCRASQPVFVSVLRVRVFKYLFYSFLMMDVSCFFAVRSAFVHISHLVSGARLSGDRSLFSSVIGPETQI